MLRKYDFVAAALAAFVTTGILVVTLPIASPAKAGVERPGDLQISGSMPARPIAGESS